MPRRIVIDSRAKALALRRLIATAFGLPRVSTPVGPGVHARSPSRTTRLVSVLRELSTGERVIYVTPELAVLRANAPLRARLTAAQRQAFDNAYDTATDAVEVVAVPDHDLDEE